MDLGERPHEVQSDEFDLRHRNALSPVHQVVQVNLHMGHNITKRI
jgi:hypothetical protein